MSGRVRDLTRAQFFGALARHGMCSEGFLGYVNLGIPGHHYCVSMFNAGTNRRARLAYLLAQRDKAVARFDAEERAKEEQTT